MKTWIKKHATLANLFFALAWTYAFVGVLHLAVVGFDWWTFADVVAYSILLWLIGDSAKKEAAYQKEIEQLTNRNQVLKGQLKGAGL